jgi:hypothetical protein
MNPMAPVGLDRILDPVGRCLSHEVARALVALRTDPDVQTRLDQLAESSTEGTLTDQDRAEYETLVRAIDFVAILQSKARRLLAGATHT